MPDEAELDRDQPAAVVAGATGAIQLLLDDHAGQAAMSSSAGPKNS